MVYHKCTLDDIPRLRQMAEITYRATFGPVNTQKDMDDYINTAFSAQKLESEILNPASAFYLGLEVQQPVGYIKLNLAPAQTEINDEDCMELERIYVLPEQQGYGYGQQLLQKAIDMAEEQQKAYIWLGVWEKNEKAIGFYQKNGFYRFGQHLFCLGQDAQTDYLMRKDLKQKEC